jgi:hypothetical protein
VITALTFGLLPAFRASQIDLAASAKRMGSETPSGGSYKLRNVLVMSEISLSVMLLIGAGLLIKSLWQLRNVDPRFDTANVIAMRISVPESQYPSCAQRAALYQSMISRLEALPGVLAAAGTNDLRFSGSRTGTSFDIQGVPPSPGEFRDTDYRTVSAEYFKVMRIRLIEGRAFTEADNLDSYNLRRTRASGKRPGSLSLMRRSSTATGRRQILSGSGSSSKTRLSRSSAW